MIRFLTLYTTFLDSLTCLYFYSLHIMGLFVYGVDYYWDFMIEARKIKIIDLYHLKLW